MDVELTSSIHQRVDEMYAKHAYRALMLSTKMLSTYFLHRRDDRQRSSLWHALLRATAEHGSAGLSDLIDLAQDDKLADVLRPSGSELDSVVSSLLVESARSAGDGQSLLMLKRILQRPGRILSLI